MTETLHSRGREQSDIWPVMGVLDHSLQISPLLISHLLTRSASYVCYCGAEGPDYFPELEGKECVVLSDVCMCGGVKVMRLGD